MTLDPASFALGLCLVGVLGYGVWAWKADRAEDRIESSKLDTLKISSDSLVAANMKRADEVAGLEARLLKVEKALQIEAPKPKAALPGFMR